MERRRLRLVNERMRHSRTDLDEKAGSERGTMLRAPCGFDSNTLSVRCVVRSFRRTTFDGFFPSTSSPLSRDAKFSLSQILIG